MNWVFELYREYLEKGLKGAGSAPTRAEMENAYQQSLREGSLKILVQEPWMGTIRFKWLAESPMSSPEIQGLYDNPMEYLLSRYGGGKFKVNFYHGMHFVATKNFKPQGEPRWQSLPEYIGD